MFSGAVEADECDGWNTIEAAWMKAIDVTEAKVAGATEADADLDAEADAGQEDQLANNLRRRRAFLVEIPHEDAIWTRIPQGDPRIALRRYLLETNRLPATTTDVQEAIADLPQGSPRSLIRRYLIETMAAAT